MIFSKWDVTNIYDRQMNGAVRYGFITKDELIRFCNLCDSRKTDALIWAYYNRSTGWSTKSQHHAVSRKIGKFILDTLKREDKKAEAKWTKPTWDGRSVETIEEAKAILFANQMPWSRGSLSSSLDAEYSGLLKAVKQLRPDFRV